MKNNWKLFLCTAFVGLIASCSSSKKSMGLPPAATISSIQFLSEFDIPFKLNFNNTTVGGLSGIDYNAKKDFYYMICDDRSAFNPARFYTAKIVISGKKIDTVYFTAVTNLLQAGGSVYPNSKTNPALTPDPEAMRYNPANQQLIWSSEGERIVTKKDTVLTDPAITMINSSGQYVGKFDIPDLLKMQSADKGPRQNGVLEGMSFDNNYRSLYVSMEEPLYEDGPGADTVDNKAFIRVLEFDVATHRNTKQFAYRLDPVAYQANPSTAFKINGVPDILAIGNGQLLVIERSFSTGRLACTIKVFIADSKVATDIKNNPSLATGNAFVPMSKKLLLNMDELGIYIDNIEGVTFGPILPNGHRSLVFIADNNFNEKEKSQVLLFEVIE